MIGYIGMLNWRLEPIGVASVACLSNICIRNIYLRKLWDIAMRLIFLSAVLGLAACSGSNNAQDESQDSEDFRPPTEQTKADFVSMIPRHFSRLDRNHDGVLTIADFPRRPERLKIWETDGKGAVSLDEFTAAETARFDAADANKDGILTSAERKAANWNGRETNTVEK